MYRMCPFGRCRFFDLRSQNDEAECMRWAGTHGDVRSGHSGTNTLRPGELLEPLVLYEGLAELCRLLPPVDVAR